MVIDKLNVNIINTLLSSYVLPMGLFFTLTGILYFSSMSAYHTQCYIFFMLPVLVLFFLDRGVWRRLWSSLSFKFLLFFLFFCAVSLLWNDASVLDLRQIKRLLLVLLFILGMVYLAKAGEDRIIKVLLLSAFSFAFAAFYSFYELYQLYYSRFYEGVGIIGIGSLSNPLLSSHIYGTMAVFIMVYFFSVERNWKKDLLLFIVFASLLGFVVLTKARTPLVALSGVFLYLLWKHRNKFVLYIVLSVLCLLTVFFVINYEMLIERGLSFRPQIWSVVLGKISTNPLLGFGFGTEVNIYIEEIQANFSDTHSLYLGLLYNIGIIGFVVWIGLNISLISKGAKNSHSILAQVGLSILLYGMLAGLTEGTNFITRPKEVWFLVWLPVALLFAAEYKQLESIREVKA